MAHDERTTQIYWDALQRVGPNLDADMQLWDLTITMDQFRNAVINTKSRDRVRDFTRNHLQLPGLKFRDVRRWLRNPALMSVEDFCLLLQTLQRLRTGTQTLRPRPKSSRGAPKRPPAAVNQKLVAHTLTLLSSLNFLMSEAKVTPADAYDSERMLIREAMHKLCTHLGINATFSDRKKIREVPLKQGELHELGTTKGDKQT